MSVKVQLLLEKILKLEKIAKGSKIKRFLANPINYIFAIFFRELYFRVFKTSAIKKAETFFGGQMNIFLPAGTDIFITGGKSHDSEIRLAKYLVKNLHDGDTFLDVGAHFGYFTLLASHLVGAKGIVYGFEPSPSTFNILKLNTITEQNIHIINKLVADKNISISFYEFPNKYSEYNTTEIDQFKNLAWYKKNKPKIIDVDSIILSDFIQDNNLNPTLIKIDVEGSETSVINGLMQYIEKDSPVLIMEYLSDDRFNHQHILAEKTLNDIGYKSHLILQNGEIVSVTNVASYMKDHHLDSENAVFTRINN